MKYYKGLEIDKMNDEQLEVFVRTILKGRKIDMGMTHSMDKESINKIERNNSDIVFSVLEYLPIRTKINDVVIKTWKGAVDVDFYIIITRDGSHSICFNKHYCGEGTVEIIMNMIRDYEKLSSFTIQFT